jgi:hypothetical protein
MRSAVLAAMDDLDVGIDQLLPVDNTQPTPQASQLWDICTESQWVSRACGWEKIDKTTTDQFPDKKATVRANRNTGKSNMVYTVYFNQGTVNRTHSWGTYHTSSRLMICVYGEAGARRFSLNGDSGTGGELQRITDTIEFIESRIQAASNG